LILGNRNAINRNNPAPQAALWYGDGLPDSGTQAGHSNFHFIINLEIWMTVISLRAFKRPNLLRKSSRGEGLRTWSFYIKGMLIGSFDRISL